MNHRKRAHKFGNAKNVRKRTSFAHSCIICNGKKCSMLKNIRDGKICAKNGMEIAAHKTYLVYAAFWCSENCAAKCWKQKWHKSGAARLGSGFCAIYVVIYLRQYRIILSADTASEVRQLLSQKRRKYWMSYRAFWQRRCRAAAAGAVLKPQGGNCAVLPVHFLNLSPLMRCQ